ncbi:hypothetical protein P154DRAFT_359261 [Amniculicola lignicola CBS 123094]|uniref:N-acetyltransferase domain-containing protein n=1 Tax=Amniculicola lignicola CBS 123094 TaxID=1392246 RepID=A0A6A5W2A8_9PLEO|nr:hypothetical protein P154DRAFT_359261 [Amniculicola lignicola CBS 123094]
MASSDFPANSKVTIAPVASEEDFAQGFYSVCEAFGRQIRDAVWIILYPEWDTPAGQEKGTAGFVKRWKNTTINKHGDPNTIFLKATVTNDKGEKRIVGMATWQQASVVEGWGDVPSEDLGDSVDGLDEKEKRFSNQALRSLWKRRVEYTKDKAVTDPESPAIFVLDMCAVDPAFQRRGIAGKLVEYGLEEAKRRCLEATTEASVMGRMVYQKLGFKAEGDGKDIEFVVDEEFKGRALPPNLFMRTGIIE